MQKIFQTVYSILLIIFLVSCQENKNPCSLSETVLKDINRIDSVINTPEIQDRNRSQMKNNYNEPSIFQADNETYRFIWSSSFEGSEIYRIEKKNNTIKVIVKKFADNDTIEKYDEFDISKEVWNNITDSLNATNFWTYPSSDDRMGLDGSTWSLEGYKPIRDKCTKKKYHRVSRWSPIDTSFISMCKLLYKLNKPRAIESTEL